ncbi:MAG: valine--tRNA ligase [Chloroflexi bacterium]|nr:valine--tRNA ligase [Chloroflexota bacterium]
MSTRPRNTEIPKAYDPSQVEERLYRFWEEGGYFTPRIDLKRQPFTIIMPPPNVTGELHLGHALTAAIEDALARYHRMLGDPTLWLPGADHAGIATQMVVERALAREGLTRHALGREAFVERVWEWVHKYGDIIDNQHRRLGTSCDWTRKRFTLDPGPSRSVRTTFVNLYRKGLIYQGERIINWCPRCSTALSDLEVEHKTEGGKLYYIHYGYEDGGGYITVATTRPETLLGDTAVAVNPKDARYRGVVGRRVLLPVLGRPIPVIADDSVTTEFGTGALKVTPAHDPTDFDIGQRHGLSLINVMNPDGTMNQEAGPYAGYERYACRDAILEQLEREGLLEKVEPWEHAVGHCQRCDTVVEPMVSKQWFVKAGPLAERAIQAVVDGRIRIIPERFVRVYLNWMESIRDWCISRQLWWGHRIPVWYCDACAEVTVAVDDPSACSRCGSSRLRQDPDVLDTWFSSALWTHSTLGWPEDAEDLRYFYPTTVMETGYDILFFWVARMIMMGLENMGQVPFRVVYLHGLIRDEKGQKMSKTRGNVLDPLNAIQEYGTDALRFALSTGTAPGNDIRLGAGRLEAGRNFANKLWNAARFVLTSLEGASGLDGWYHRPPREHRHDRWILSRLNRLVALVRSQWNAYQLGEAQQAIHDFLWGEFCDWYLELAKVRLRAGDTDPLPVLAHVLERTLRLLHPFMPFITEEVWQSLVATLPREGDLPDSIMVAPYPEADSSALDDGAEAEMELVTGIIRAIRNTRAEFRVETGRTVDALVDAADFRLVLGEEAAAIQHLARVGALSLVDRAGERPADAVTVVVGKVAVTVPLGGVVDMAAERRRLEAELSDCQRNIQRLEARLRDGQFLEKAPADVVDRERQRHASLAERRGRIEELLRQMEG